MILSNLSIMQLKITKKVFKKVSLKNWILIFKITVIHDLLFPNRLTALLFQFTRINTNTYFYSVGNMLL